MVETMLILLATSLAAVALVQRLGLSPIVGYLLVGVAVGPYGFAWIQASEDIYRLAEFGIVFLMFTIGLEFSLPRLLADRTMLLGLGGLQIGLTTLVFALPAAMLGLHPAAAFAVGTALAMSSTAIVTRLMIEQGELNSRLGRAAICVLLFQDLVTIVVLLVLPVLASGTQMAMLSDIVAVLLKGGAVFLALLFVGRWAVRPFFRRVASAHSPELFMLAVLLTAIAAAKVSQFAGLSAALGGFMAGMVLGETEFRHQVEADLRPFQDVLLGLFFITIGMLVNLDLLTDYWAWVLLLVIIIVLTKGFLVALISKLRGTTTTTAVRTGIVLAQGGEFSLVILFLAIQMDLLAGIGSQVVLSAVLVTMAIAPLFIRYNAHIAERLTGVSIRQIRTGMAERVAEVSRSLESHVIVCGYGRVGQNVTRFLAEEGIEYVALDLDPYRLRATIDAGERIGYGDATRRQILNAAGLERAQAVVITYNDTRAALKTLSHVHEVRPDITVLVRAADEMSLEELLNAGATEVIPDSLEASLTLAAHLLMLLGVPVSRVAKRSAEIRADRYRLLRSLFHGRERSRRRDRLHVITVPKNAYAVGRTLKELNLGKARVTVTAVRRRGIRGADPAPDMRVAAEDALILHGTPEALDQAERHLLTGEGVVSLQPVNQQ